MERIGMNNNLDRKMDDVYSEGFKAYADGIKIKDNPYNNLENGWDVRRHWEWGWECAKKMGYQHN